ncbi:MAG: hypothetical protein ACRET2_14810, partial [Steroidobacteraceae bacterium]
LLRRAGAAVRRTADGSGAGGLRIPGRGGLTAGIWVSSRAAGVPPGIDTRRVKAENARWPL